MNHDDHDDGHDADDEDDEDDEGVRDWRERVPRNLRSWAERARVDSREGRKRSQKGEPRKRTLKGSKDEAARRRSPAYLAKVSSYKARKRSASPAYDRAAAARQLHALGKAGHRGKGRKDLNDLQIARILASPAGGKPRASSREVQEELEQEGVSIGRDAILRLRKGASYLWRLVTRPFFNLQKGGKPRGRPIKMTPAKKEALVNATLKLHERNAPPKKMPKGKKPGSKKRKPKFTPMYEIRALAEADCSDTSARRALAETGRPCRPNRKRTAMDQVDMSKALKWAQAMLKWAWREVFKTQCVFLDLKKFAIRTSLRAQLNRCQTQAAYRTRKEGKKHRYTKLTDFKATPGKRDKIFAASGFGAVLQWELVEDKFDTTQYIKYLRRLRTAVEKKMGWTRGVQVFLLHDNEKPMANPLAEQIRAELNFHFLWQPANCPRVQPWDYDHWSWIENRMLEMEVAAGGYLDYKQRTGKRTMVEGYHATLKEVAMSMPQDHIDKAHCNLWDRCEALVKSEGGFFEDGEWRTPGQRKMQRVNREIMKLRLQTQFGEQKWAQDWRARHGVEPLDPSYREGQLAKLQAVLQTAAEEAARELKEAERAAANACGGADAPEDAPADAPPDAPPDAPADAPSAPPPKDGNWASDFFSGVGAWVLSKAPRVRHESLEDAYLRRWLHESPGDPRIHLVDAGIHAHRSTMACLWLSVCMAVSRVPEASWGQGGPLWAPLRAVLREVAAAPAAALRWQARRVHSDGLGRAATQLRVLVCGWMLGREGARQLAPFYDPVTRGEGWRAFIERTRVDAYADEHHLRALSALLGVHIRVVSSLALRNEDDVTHYAPPAGGPALDLGWDIALANNDVHYTAFLPPDQGVDVD